MKYLIGLIIILLSFNSKAPILSEAIRQDRIETFILRQKQLTKDIRIKEIKQLEFTPKLLIEYLELIELNNEVILRQFILESAWFNSYLFKKYNNISGMRLAKIRPTVASGEALNHAKYKHWTIGIEDYKLWLTYYIDKGIYVQNNSNISYYKFLEDINYAESKKYIQTLKNIDLNKLS